MGTPKDMINKYTKDKLSHDQYFELKIGEVQKDLDKVLARIYKARLLKRERNLNPKEQHVLDLLLAQKAELVEWINNLRMKAAL